MSRIYEPTPKQVKIWKKWVNSRPPEIKEVAERFDPWSLYRMKDTGHKVTILGFSEGETVTISVTVSGKYNKVLFERNVFGVDPNDLEPCDPPDPSEPVGAALTQEEASDNMDLIREMAQNGRPKQ